VLLMMKAVRGREVLFAALELTWLDELARQADLPRDTSLFIADRDGTIVAGAAPRRLAAFEELTQRREGMVRVDDLLCVAVPLRDANGLWVVVGVPATTIRSIGNRIFYRDLAVLTLFAAFVFAASIVAAQRHREATESRETLRALTHRMETIREEEARRIAQELHDELGQQLTVLRMELENLRRKVGSNRSIDDMCETIDDAIQSVRRISSELRPGVLDRLGLTAALEWLLRELERRASIRTELHATGVSENIGSEIATTLFRVTQEAMTNVIRHSGASSVSVDLRQDGDRITLRIRDDGRGFDAGNVARTSLGLVGMRERVRRLGGSLEIVSAPGEGTELIATVNVEGSCFSYSSSTTTPSYARV
jgi:signal transduction histidine kinase